MREVFKTIFIKSIDGVIILFFVTTSLTSYGASQCVLLISAIPIMIFIALIMGISAVLATRAEQKHFFSSMNRDMQAEEDLKEKLLLENLGIGIEVQALAQEEIEKDRKNWQNLIVKLKDDENMTSTTNPFKNGLTTFFSYILGGTIPIAAYFFTENTFIALPYSSFLSLTVLFILGYFKSAYLKTPMIGGAMATLFSGLLAGIAGYFISKLFIQLL